MKQFIIILNMLFVTFFATGCSISSKINIADYKENIKTKENIPPICEAQYKKKKPSVAIINFTNNSNFGAATINEAKSEDTAGFSFGLSGFKAGSKSGKSSSTRIVDPKLASSFVPLIENMILNTGGTRLFTRSDLDKVDTELKLQDSGLLDPNSVVEFGLTSGVEYIVTGSIDYVKHKFNNYSKYTGGIAEAAKYSDNDKLKIATSVINFATSFLDGTTVETAITVKIIDVSTGKIVFSEQIKKDTKINTQKKSSYTQLVGAVKDCVSEALPILQSQFQEYFALRGYITKLRRDGSDAIAQINLGRDDKIKEGQEFVVLKTESSFDPLSHKESCDLMATDIKLTATEHISKNNSWLRVENADDVKLLQLVQKVK